MILDRCYDVKNKKWFFCLRDIRNALWTANVAFYLGKRGISIDDVKFGGCRGDWGVKWCAILSRYDEKSDCKRIARYISVKIKNFLEKCDKDRF